MDASTVSINNYFWYLLLLLCNGDNNDYFNNSIFNWFWCSLLSLTLCFFNVASLFSYFPQYYLSPWLIQALVLKTLEILHCCLKILNIAENSEARILLFHIKLIFFYMNTYRDLFIFLIKICYNVFFYGSLFIIFIEQSKSFNLKT